MRTRPVWFLVILSLLCAAALGCDGSSSERATSEGESRDAGMADAGDAASGAPRCTEPAPTCLQSCGSDFGLPPACGEFGWTCPDGFVMWDVCSERVRCDRAYPPCCTMDGTTTPALCVDGGSPWCPMYTSPCAAN